MYNKSGSLFEDHLTRFYGPFLKALILGSIGAKMFDIGGGLGFSCDAMSKRLKINPKILWAEPGSLDRSLNKGELFEKRYEKMEK